MKWKLKDKYKDCCHNSSCDSFDTCIECWDEWAERNPPMTNADRIRAMSDEELADEFMRFFAEVLNTHTDGDWSFTDDFRDELLKDLRQPVKDGEGDGA